MVRATVLLAALAWGGCTATSLDGTEWTLLRAETLEGTLAPASITPDAAPMLQFEDDRIAGSDGCNQFSGSFQIADDGRLTTSQLVSTKRACLPPVDALSNVVLGTLDAQTLASEVAGDELRLSAGGTVLVYTRRQEPSATRDLPPGTFRG